MKTFNLIGSLALSIGLLGCGGTGSPSLQLPDCGVHSVQSFGVATSTMTGQVTTTNYGLVVNGQAMVAWAVVPSLDHSIVDCQWQLYYWDKSSAETLTAVG